MDSRQIKKLTEEARKIVAAMSQERPYVVAAYSDGSFAREDMVRGSDVDIGFVVENGHGEQKISRRIIDGIIFEWGFFERNYYENVDSILEDAGFTHDIASAKIWFDTDDFLQTIQALIRQRYREPELIRKRAENQVAIIEATFTQLQQATKTNDAFNMMTKFLTAMRHLFAIPTAVLNKPVTHCRAYLYCKRDAEELGFDYYPNLMLEILGSSGFTREQVERLLTTAHTIYDNSGLPLDAIETHKAHFEIVEYMLGINEPAGAVWPLVFWLVGPLCIGDFGDKQAEQNVFAALPPIRRALSLAELEDVKAKFSGISQAITMAKEIIATT